MHKRLSRWKGALRRNNALLLVRAFVCGPLAGAVVGGLVLVIVAAPVLGCIGIVAMPRPDAAILIEIGAWIGIVGAGIGAAVGLVGMIVMATDGWCTVNHALRHFQRSDRTEMCDAIDDLASRLKGRLDWKILHHGIPPLVPLSSGLTSFIENLEVLEDLVGQVARCPGFYWSQIARREFADLVAGIITLRTQGRPYAIHVGCEIGHYETKCRGQTWDDPVGVPDGEEYVVDSPGFVRVSDVASNRAIRPYIATTTSDLGDKILLEYRVSDDAIAPSQLAAR